ncbi:MAG: PEP-CTERM sorting domain-containing protein [Planctomycetota bacterium]
MSHLISRLSLTLIMVGVCSSTRAEIILVDSFDMPLSNPTIPAGVFSYETGIGELNAERFTSAFGRNNLPNTVSASIANGSLQLSTTAIDDGNFIFDYIFENPIDLGSIPNWAIVLDITAISDAVDIQPFVMLGSSSGQSSILRQGFSISSPSSITLASNADLASSGFGAGADLGSIEALQFELGVSAGGGLVIDSLRIIPEPSAVMVLLATGVLFANLRRRD